MQGISSQAAGPLINKNKTFQGQKFDDDLGIDYYSFKWRNHDPQIGRFIEIDPVADEYEYNSTYAFSENKVTSHVELEGLEAVPNVQQVIEEAEAAVPVIEKYGDNIAHGIGITFTAIGAWVSSNLDKVAAGMETFAKSGVGQGAGYPMTLDLYIKKGASDAAKAQIAPPKPAVPTVVQITKKGPKDLVGDAKLQQQKEAATATRASNKQAQTNRGNTRTGNSNTLIKGQHGKMKGGNKGDKDSNGNARRAKDQKIKGPNDTN